jgi:hypothetical protein
MQETEMLKVRLRDASGLPAVLAAGWDVFEFIQQTASAYDDPEKNARGYAFMLTTVAACRGRNALADAPSLPGDDTADGDESPVCVLADEHQAAQALADLADMAARRLADAARTAQLADRHACERAMTAATEVHHLLSTDGAG